MLTAAIAEQLCSCVRCGMSIEAAAYTVGVSSRSVRRWRAAGEVAKNGTPERALFVGILLGQATAASVLVTATVERGRMRP